MVKFFKMEGVYTYTYKRFASREDQIKAGKAQLSVSNISKGFHFCSCSGGEERDGSKGVVKSTAVIFCHLCVQHLRQWLADRKREVKHNIMI